MCTILHVHIRSKYCYTLVCFFLSVADVSGTQFWRYPFVNLCSPKRFVEFMVMQVDIVPEKDRPHRVPVSNKVRGITLHPPPKRKKKEMYLLKIENFMICKRGMIQGRHIMHLPFPPFNFFFGGGVVFVKYDCNMYLMLYSPYKSIGMCKGASKQFADFKNYIACWVLKFRDQPHICLYIPTVV